MFTQLSATIIQAAEGTEEYAPLIAPPAVIGLVIFAIFMTMLFVTLSFTNVGKRHEAKPEHVDPQRTLPSEHHGPKH